MKKYGFLLAMLLMFLMPSLQASECGRQWHGKNGQAGCSMLDRAILRISLTPVLPYVSSQVRPVRIRSGYLKENPYTQFKGNVLYFEGLADSMLNHMPLFNELTNAGYRVIAFDYAGQGGSTGSMNQMSIQRIVDLGEAVYSQYARKEGEKILLGWSTGGLAAYSAVHQGKASKVILIAPGIPVRMFVGENHISKLQFSNVTLDTLTRRTYTADGSDPHVEDIKPKSPLNVPLFAANLVMNSLASKKWRIPGHVKGLVLLAGDDDKYVNTRSVREVVETNAQQFEIIQFKDSFHEIDNELPQVSQLAYKQILSFLDGATQD